MWRPKQGIRGAAIGIVKHKGCLLVCEVLGDNGDVKGWRALGGGIEFGEPAAEALKREFKEELGCEIQITGSPMISENIYEHHGHTGHEIIFAFPIELKNPEIYETQRFQIFEHEGTSHWAEWVAIERFKTREQILFPPALADKILSS